MIRKTSQLGSGFGIVLAYTYKDIRFVAAVMAYLAVRLRDGEGLFFKFATTDSVSPRNVSLTTLGKHWQRLDNGAQTIVIASE